MKKSLLGLLLAVCCLAFSKPTSAQTNLNLGDVAITGYNFDNPDAFTFVILVDVTAGTTITFTDNGWFAAGGFRANEGTATITFTSAAVAGTEFLVGLADMVVETSPLNPATATYAVDSNNPNFSASGDQIFMYQGAAPTAGDESNFITAITSNNPTWDADATSSTTTALPTVFTDGVNALAIPEVDNNEYNRNTTTGDAATLLSAIYTLAAWDTGSNTAGAVPLNPMDYTVSGGGAVTPADQPTLAGDMNICPNASANIMVTAGNLNDATAWVLYTGSCGGTQVATSATGDFMVSPAATTTYFVGGNSTAGTDPCESFTVTVDPDVTPPVITAPADITTTSTETTPEFTGTATATDNCSASGTPAPFISEIHYDNAGGDTGEFIEITGPAGLDLSGWQLVPYNGSNGTSYSIQALSGTIPDEGAGFGAISFPISGLQNGAPDGVALVDADGMVVEFLSYEGDFTATNGPAAGMMSFNIGVSQGGDPIGNSMQLQGPSGMTEWMSPVTESPGMINAGLVVGGSFISITFADVVSPGACAGEVSITRTWTATDGAGNSASADQLITVSDTEAPIILAPGDITIPCTQTDFSPAATGGVATAYDPGVGVQPVIVPFINEIHYDNTGGDVNEFVEIAGLAGEDLTGYTVVLYNGSNGNPYQTIPVTGALANQSSGFGFIVVPASGLQNGSPDGIALVDAGGVVLEFLSYEGSFTAATGPAAGMASTDIGITEGGGTQVGESIQRTGPGAAGADFVWTGPTAETPGAINEGQSTTAVGPIATTFTEVISGDGMVITRTFSATDDCGNMTTDGDYVQVITIGDVPPRLECRQTTATCADPNLCGINDLTVLPPFVFDDCDSGLPFTLTSDAPTFYPVGTTIVTFTATNDAGTTSCETEVIIVDESAPVINCGGGAITVLIEDEDLCFGSAFINPLITDNCGIASVTGTGIFNYTPGVYTQTVVATDVNGLSSSCDYTIYVHDVVAPTALACPENLTITSPLPQTPIGLPQPFFSDNCGISGITNDAPAGGFPQGTTTVTFTASDLYGNQGSCSFDVTIVGGIALNEMPDISASLTESNSARVVWNEPSGITACEICAETEINDYRFIGNYFGHQYFLFEGEGVSRSTAENMALTLDAHLVTIGSEGENRFLKAALNDELPEAWMGLSQADELTWLTEEGVDFTNFAEGYEAASGETAGVLGLDGMWSMASTDAEKVFIIERPCIQFEQTGPVYTDAETGEEALLTCGSDFEEGTHQVTYRATDMCGNESEYTFDVVVQEETAEICQTGGSEQQVWIDDTGIDAYVQNSGNDEGFGDYSDTELTVHTAIDQSTGEWTTVPMTVSAGGNSDEEELFYRVWMDRNGDGDFFDADEMLAETMTTGAWNFDLPAFEEEVPTTIMRVMVSKYNYPEVCGLVQQGEAEDYLVHILETHVRGEGEESSEVEVAKINANQAVPSDLMIFPNPAYERITVNMADFLGQNAVLTLSDSKGQITYSQDFENISQNEAVIDVNNQATGVYLVTLYTKEGQIQTAKVVIER